MANTSDSEDFESADEEFTEDKPAVVPSLKDNCQKELNKLQTTSHLTKEPQPCKHVDEPTLITGVGIEQDDSTMEAEAANSPVRQPPADKRRRQQKPREPKPQTKLGTRITSSPAEVSLASKPMEEEGSEEEIDCDPFAQFRGYSLPPAVETCWEPEDEEKPVVDDEPAPSSKETKAEDEPTAAIDPYAKFRGYSQPPLMQRCWETDEDGKPILDDHPGKISDTKDEVVAEDPYAKFRGFSKPPLMQRCWVTDSDGKPILDNHEKKVTEKLDAVDDHPKVEETLALAETEEDEEGDVDPFAMFRGYTVEPEKETGWEDDVDDVEIDEDEEEEEAEEKQPISESVSHQEAPDIKTTPTAPNAAPTAAPASTGFGWGGWGVSSLLATATESVASLTSQVSSALEAGIGAPDPAELARRDKLEERLLGEMSAGEPGPREEQGQAASSGDLGETSGMFGFVSSFTRLVETTGTKVLTGGLDTLESIGKKTMEVLQEGDPGLKKKRAMFSDKTVLSQILREAKDKAEVEDKEAEVKQAERAVHFETLFDDFQGLVHLEALEMLSKQCELKLQALALASAGPVLTALQRRLREVRDACQLPEDEDETEEGGEEGRWLQALGDAEKQLGVPIAIGKLDEIVTESREWLREWADAGSERSTAHARAVSTLARLTAASAEQFHKTAEMLLVKENRDANVEAQALITVTTVLCAQVSAAATRFCEALSGAETTPAEDVNSAITSIFLEASNSSSYIQEAFQLLIPVLQVGSAL